MHNTPPEIRETPWLLEHKNGKPRLKQPLSGMRPLFAPGTTALGVPQLSAETLEILNTPPPPIQVNLEELRPFASDVAAASAETFITRLAASRFDSDPTRSHLRQVAKAVAAAVSRKMVEISLFRTETRDVRDSVDQFTFQPSRQAPRVLTMGNLPNLIALCAWIAVFLGAVMAEIKNAMYLVMTSGLEFAEDPIGAICFSMVYVLAPLTIFKFALSEMRFRARQRFNTTTAVIGIPAAVFGIVLFAWKIGNMQEDVDLFAEGTGGIDPPFWLVMATGMILLAFCVMIIPLFIRSSIRQVFSYDVRENATYRKTSKRIAACDEVLTELEALRIRMDGVIQSLDAERERYVAECITGLRRARNHFQARQSSLLADC